jgi:hypothetical protein
VIARLLGRQSAWRRVLAVHPGEVVLPTLIVAWPDSDRKARRAVIAMLADERGISLRDRQDREVDLLPADGILSVELAPLTRTAFRPLRVTTLGQGTLDLALSQVRPDDQIDIVMRVRDALGRT